jgi:hypothetical protein
MQQLPQLEESKEAASSIPSLLNPQDVPRCMMFDDEGDQFEQESLTPFIEGQR